MIEISGGSPLCGNVAIQGSKNAVLPMIAAGILTEEKVILTNCPHIDDVYTMLNLMRELGCDVSFKDHVLEIDSGNISNYEIKQEMAKKVRSSITLLGSLLGRLGNAKLPFPGGCTIGARPINLHIENLEKMGVTFSVEEDVLTASAKEIIGADIKFYKKSVGAAQNCIMAAVLAKGVTRIKGISIEPEVMELCALLRKMGAVILRTDYDEIMIKGVEKLHGIKYRVPSDRIVAGTYMLAAVATRGEIFLENTPVNQMHSIIYNLRKINTKITCKENGILIDGKVATGSIPYIATENYPGFPTDLQSPLVAALTMADEKSVVEEKIFEKRFKIASQLNKMNANIKIDGRKLIVYPVSKLCGTSVEAEELRGGAALVIAGLMAEGKTRIHGCQYIRRGYEDIVKDFSDLGADIKTIGEHNGIEEHDGPKVED